VAEVAKKGIDWSSLWKKEDWWACWIGGFVLILGIAGILYRSPTALKTWTFAAPLKFLPKGIDTVGEFILLLLLTWLILFLLTSIGLIVMRGWKGWGAQLLHLPGLGIIFGLVVIAFFAGTFKPIKDLGLVPVLWALILGLLISNIFGIPKWLKYSINTEFYIKCGLVMLGAEILFSTIIKAGAVGMGQALAVVLVVWLVAYWLGRRFGIEERFSGVLATGVSICGVSASIAAGGALRGDPKHVAYTVSWVLVIAIPMLFFLPLCAKAFGISEVVAGAWFGGTIDTTAAVVAAGELIGPKAMTVAALVKMAQNVLIGFTAFVLACWAVLALERRPGERPPIAEIWWRFPKFIVGFIVASILFSLLEPYIGHKAVKGILGITKTWRVLWFVMAFISIGLDTRFKELLVVGGGRPALVFILAQIFNIFWTLGICYLLWGGIFFAPPKI